MKKTKSGSTRLERESSLPLQRLKGVPSENGECYAYVICIVGPDVYSGMDRDALDRGADQP